MVFLVIELAALIIGLVLANLTKTISDLYRATQFVREGNFFGHRVLWNAEDATGLGESLQFDDQLDQQYAVDQARQKSVAALGK